MRSPGRFKKLWRRNLEPGECLSCGWWPKGIMVKVMASGHKPTNLLFILVLCADSWLFPLVRFSMAQFLGLLLSRCHFWAISILLLLHTALFPDLSMPISHYFHIVPYFRIVIILAAMNIMSYSHQTHFKSGQLGTSAQLQLGFGSNSWNALSASSASSVKINWISWPTGSCALGGTRSLLLTSHILGHFGIQTTLRDRVRVFESALNDSWLG